MPLTFTHHYDRNLIPTYTARFAHAAPFAWCSWQLALTFVVLREFGLHAVFITANKEMRLLRHHTRSAVVVHRRGVESSLVSLSWEALDEHYQQRIKALHEVAH